MKQYFFVFSAISIWLLMAFSVSASNPNTATAANGHSTTTDASGNVYVSGYFNSSTITFGSFTLTKTNTISGSSNVFLVKYDPGGNVLWATRAGGSSGYDEPYGIATDGIGNVYVTGTFNSPTITFFPVLPSGTTITLSNPSMFIVKYDQDGNVLWAQRATAGAGWQDIAISGENVYVTGFFNSTITFGTTTLTSAGGGDMFIVSYDLNGNVLWARSAGGSGLDEGTGIAADAGGNVLVTGWFNSSSIAFGTTVLINKGKQDIFLVKYDASGTVLWASNAGGSGYDSSWGIATDGSGNAYVTGGFTSPSITFYGTSSGTITFLNPSNGYGYMFLVKYGPGGNVIWGDSKPGCGQGVVTDQAGNVFLTGTFSSSVTFGTTLLTSLGGVDLFVVKYNSGGIVLWAKSAGGSLNDVSQAAATDGNGNVLVTGYFKSLTITFGTINLTLSNKGNQDMFVAKYNNTNGNVFWAKRAGGASIGHGKPKSAIAGTDDPISVEIIVYPNPTSGKVTLSIAGSQPGINIISVFDMIGKEVFSRQLAPDGYRDGSQLSEIDLSAQPKGVYLVVVKAGENYYQRKIIVE